MNAWPGPVANSRMLGQSGRAGYRLSVERSHVYRIESVRYRLLLSLFAEDGMVAEEHNSAKTTMETCRRLDALPAG